MVGELSIILAVLKTACKDLPIAGIKLVTESMTFKNKSIKTKFLKIDEREIKATIKLTSTIKDNT